MSVIFIQTFSYEKRVFQQCIIAHSFIYFEEGEVEEEATITTITIDHTVGVDASHHVQMILPVKRKRRAMKGRSVQGVVTDIAEEAVEEVMEDVLTAGSLGREFN